VFPSNKDLFGYLREIYLLTARVPSTLSVLLLVAAVLGVIALRKRSEVAAALVCVAVLGPALMLLVSLYKPIFGTRLLLWASPPFFALVGAGVTQRWPYVFAPSFLLAVCALVEPQLRRDYTDLTNEPWREVVSAIHSHEVERGRILTATFEEATMFDYYMHRSRLPFPEIPVVSNAGATHGNKRAVRTTCGIVDRKAGRRSNRVRRDLTKRGTIVWEHIWNERLRVTEIDLTRRPPQSSASLN
jgi:hypothetical protein